MDPITLFFILKALGLGFNAIALEGDKSYLDAADIVDFLQSIDVGTDPATRQLRSILQLLVRLHTVRILLYTASSAPSNDPQWQGKFIVPAYGDDEVVPNSVWLVGATAIEDVVAKNDTQLGIKFVDGLVQKREFDPILHVEQPVLQPFLTKFKGQLSNNFDPDVCLGACYQSAVRALLHSHTKSVPCIAKALNLLRLIWGPEIKSNLSEVNGWFADTPDPLTDTKGWIVAKLLSQSLLSKLTAIYAQSAPAPKLEVSKITAMLQANGGTFFRIWPRFSDARDGLEHLRDWFKNQTTTSANEQQQWDNLLAATYGAIAWRFWQQANLAVQMLQAL